MTDNYGNYSNKPLLALLESYVLAVIDALPNGRDEQIAQLVKRVFGGDNNWRETIRGVAGLHPQIDAYIQDTWRVVQSSAQNSSKSVDAQVFARDFVATNFASHLD